MPREADAFIFVKVLAGGIQKWSGRALVRLDGPPELDCPDRARAPGRSGLTTRPVEPPCPRHLVRATLSAVGHGVESRSRIWPVTTFSTASRARLRHASAGPQPGYNAEGRELAERESVN